MARFCVFCQPVGEERGGGRSRIEHAPGFGYLLTVRRADCQRLKGKNSTPPNGLASPRRPTKDGARTKPTTYRFSFGPWNISTGADPFGPTVRKEMEYARKLKSVQGVGF